MVLVPGSAHARLSARPPINTSGILLAHVCRVTFKHFTQHFLKNPKNAPGGGVPEFFWVVNISFFVKKTAFFFYQNFYGARTKVRMDCNSVGFGR